ncbi:hypothetical protein PVK06_021126 [Gossypium arboreum]|uniref:Uncharacterized protein n=1 Tax=Gossypium arboreum TaxID=29729 RepID=A0ABR0PPN1_GOSAR|nr:hypothetical protein PVK06_021126 [Gossypium arboreum]
MGTVVRDPELARSASLPFPMRSVHPIDRESEVIKSGEDESTKSGGWSRKGGGYKVAFLKTYYSVVLSSFNCLSADGDLI